jgi:hypothetical protein
MAKKINIPTVKNEAQYEALRDKGMSKEKASVPAMLCMLVGFV